MPQVDFFLFTLLSGYWTGRETLSSNAGLLARGLTLVYRPDGHSHSCALTFMDQSPKRG